MKSIDEFERAERLAKQAAKSWLAAVELAEQLEIVHLAAESERHYWELIVSQEKKK